MAPSASTSAAAPPLAKDGQPVKMKKKRNRKVLSCNHCRVKKLKCDRLAPCTACATRSVHCTNLDKPKPSSNAAALGSTSKRRTATSTRRAAAVGNPGKDSVRQPSGSASASSPHSSGSSSTYDSDADGSDNDYIESDTLRGAFSWQATSDLSLAFDERDLPARLPPAPVSSLRPTLPSSSDSDPTPSFTLPSIAAQAERIASASAPPSYQMQPKPVVTAVPQVAASASLVAGYTLPPDTQCRAMLLSYFAHVNTKLPLVHRPSFWKDYELDLARTHTGYRGTVFGMLSLASVNDPDHPEWHQHAHEYSEAARDTLFLGGGAFDLYWLTSITLMLMSAIAVQSPSAKYMLTWAVRTAVSYKAHCCNASLWTSSQLVDEMRKRLWWSLALCELVLASQSGDVSAFDCSLTDCGLPGANSDAELADTSMSVQYADRGDSYEHSANFARLLAVCQAAYGTLLAIRQGSNNMHAAIAHLTRFDTNLIKSEHDNVQPITAYHSIVSSSLQIMLHESLAASWAGRSLSAYTASTQVCMAAVMRVQQKFAAMQAQAELWPLSAALAAISERFLAQIASSQGNQPIVQHIATSISSSLTRPGLVRPASDSSDRFQSANSTAPTSAGTWAHDDVNRFAAELKSHSARPFELSGMPSHRVARSSWSSGTPAATLPWALGSTEDTYMPCDAALPSPGSFFPRRTSLPFGKLDSPARMYTPSFGLATPDDFGGSSSQSYFDNLTRSDRYSTL
ncbi:uncharacterized protein L969DRAFT_16040 [Mixia osmundae IAM 14324]|nr:uncharacterized protein L969DRAFT_16040 [Mixia osmundae IAM 14324]KEI40677.1 hypothetical protein L969DRAFT_16040 [Mixia osmundae IAM 14324]